MNKETKVTRKINEYKRLYTISLPKSFIDTLGIVKDEYINMELKGKKIIITKQLKENTEVSR